MKPDYALYLNVDIRIKSEQDKAAGVIRETCLHIYHLTLMSLLLIFHIINIA